MMKTKRQKTITSATEYRLFIAPKYSEQMKCIVTFVGLRTVEEFSNFRYEIVVEDSTMNHVLRLDIHGLRTPRQTLPSFGPAIFKKEYPELKGIEEIIVSKLDGEENSFLVHMTKSGLAIKKAPKERFVELVTNEEEW